MESSKSEAASKLTGQLHTVAPKTHFKHRSWNNTSKLFYIAGGQSKMDVTGNIPVSVPSWRLWVHSLPLPASMAHFSYCSPWSSAITMAARNMLLLVPLLWSLWDCLDNTGQSPSQAQLIDKVHSTCSFKSLSLDVLPCAWLGFCKLTIVRRMGRLRMLRVFSSHG